MINSAKVTVALKTILRARLLNEMVRNAESRYQWFTCFVIFDGIKGFRIGSYNQSLFESNTY